MTMTLVRLGSVTWRKRPKIAGAVDFGGFVQLARDRLQAGQQHHREEGRAGPDHGHDDRPQRQVVVAEPLHQVCAQTKSQ